MSNDLKFYLDVLQSDQCQCERKKKPRMALCYKCYSKLPPDLQRGLWKRLRAGFEEAYEEAVARW